MDTDNLASAFAIIFSILAILFTILGKVTLA